MDFFIHCSENNSASALEAPLMIRFFIPSFVDGQKKKEEKLKKKKNEGKKKERK